MTNYSNHVYNNLDQKIDEYLGTSNLRPGPARRLVNDIKETKDKKEIKESKVNYFSYSMSIANTYKWEEYYFLLNID